MKKLLSLVLVVALVLAVASFASATVTIGGNVRMWWQSEQNNNLYINEFKFDRIGIQVNADNGQGLGISTNTEFRNVRTDKDLAIGGSIDIRNDYVFIYDNNLVTKGDKLLVGAFDGQYPFKNGYSNVMTFGGLGDALKLSIVTGAVYQLTQPTWDFAVGVCNPTQSTDTNAAPTSTNKFSPGYDYALRVNFKPVAGLKAGLGYQNVVLVNGSKGIDGTLTGADPSKNYDTMWIVDCSYSKSDVPYSGMIEYASIAPTINGTSQDAVTGMYVEGGYKIGAITLIAGRGINLTSSSSNDTYYKNNIFGYINQSVFTTQDKATNLVTIDNDYSVLGILYPFSSNTFLQAEYIIVDNGAHRVGSNKDESAFGVRLRYNF